MTGREAQLRDPAFRKWMIERHSFDPASKELEQHPAMVRADGFFDVAAYDAWLDRQYREFKR